KPMPVTTPLKRILIFAARLTESLHLTFLWFPLYALALFIIKRLLPEGPFLKVWPRNSYTSGALLPPLSDLDLTILYDADKIRQTHLKERIRKCQKLIPLFKEANVYPLHGIKTLCTHINPYELQRDQELLHYLRQNNLPFPSSGRGKALAFLFRALEADIEALSHYPDLRIKRWRNLASILGHPSSMNRPLEDIFDLAAKLSREEIDTALLREFIMGALSFEEKFEIFWPFFPVKYLLYSLDKKSAVVAPYTIRPPTPLEQEVLEAHLDWEIWGLFGQSVFASPQHYAAHLNNLKTIAFHYFDKARQKKFNEAFRIISCYNS
ncbi:MAG: hypothetical protein OXB88_03845, partial [Bacteriovoracales bacterium]|nr:hypothetical protein [Bacteriovoracales bacterium]